MTFTALWHYGITKLRFTAFATLGSHAEIYLLLIPTARENVKVTVRLRPPNETELARTDYNIWDVDSNEHRLSLERNFAEKNRKQLSEFFYDEIFTGSDNIALFDRGVKDTIKATMEGFNVFAYGQTSSGKTFRNEKEFLLRVSYMEIYNEKINDLLAPVNKDLKIHEDKLHGIHIPSLSEVVVTKPSEVMKEISRGELNRHTGSTNWNERSSRSHTLFRMVVESSSKDSTPRRFSPSSSHKASGSVSVSNLIDLAGSEKAASDVERRKEGAFINKSLLTLGNVISKLTDGSGGHIPFRDSKLTRILQNSLIGNARISVICTISPSSENIDESVNTLKFASRVKELIDDKALIKKYRMEIEELKAQLEKTGTYKEEEISVMLQQERAKYEEKFVEMELVRTALKKRIDDLTSLILNSTSFAPSSSRKPSSDSVVVPAIDSRIDEFEMLIEEKNSKIDSLTSEISEKNKLIEGLKRQLETSKNANNSDLQLTLTELDEKLKDKDDELMSYRNLVEELEIIVEEDKKLIKEKDSKIQELSKIIEDDKKLIDENNLKIKELSSKIEVKNMTIQELSSEVAKKNNVVEKRDTKIKELSSELTIRDASISERSTEIQGLALEKSKLSKIVDDDKRLLQALSLDMSKKNKTIDELKNHYRVNTKTIKDLKEQLSKKDQEIILYYRQKQDLEEKLEVQRVTKQRGGSNYFIPSNKFLMVLLRKL
ncbi:1867_t:CDS:10 [Entrophospora sp. SA101]|nr:1867_t:CDS:10 [Entrophospora sp. SA101]